ncbi:hypothetical protein CROQUDRAFT_651267 [Cronartium quercuum f. sp. fusiforme G11]|uniref:Dihydrolipoamide acetyltransferase component of pyruvate dehydrogenase complex n=1 Tax=Cronartium quercuum f. sp. fusiforme G11 TaxID=708437 RepID=A0A9P6NXP4_9BASI|nr:hypothetical protein CROQUDRAFT_651267 [Cronartium quercuum f. sp. fusiforme G11]
MFTCYPLSRLRFNSTFAFPVLSPLSSVRLTPRVITCSPSASSQPHSLRFASIRSLSSTIPRKRPIPDGHILKPFLLADIGEGITACEILKWLVEPNQQVAEFDPVCEVQSDKATVEITSPFEGTIFRLFGAAGEVIKVGQPLCEIAVKEELNDKPAPPPRIEPIIAPEVAGMDVAKQALKAAPLAQPISSGSVHSTPAVRRLAKEHDVDIGTISGTGKHQRVTKEDVLLHLSRSSATELLTTAFTPSAPSNSSLSSSPAEGSLRVPFSAVRQAMFRNMTHSLKIPHFGYSEQIDVTELERVRQELNSFPGETRRLTLFSLLIKATAHALRFEPVFRSTLIEPASFLERQSVDISIALSSPHGLLTPLIPNVERKTVYDIAEHVRRLRNFIETVPVGDRLPVFPDELGGNKSGTFTLSNIGVIGGTYTFPVIPPTGQLAIGAFGKIQVQPGYRPGAISSTSLVSGESVSAPEPRLILYASFSADHRAVEGVELARLVQRFKEICERPSSLIGLGV